MDESEKQSVDWDFLETDTFQRGRERLVRDIKQDVRTFGIAAVGTTVSVEAVRVVGSLNSDAEPFVILYPCFSVALFSCVMVASAHGILENLRSLKINNQWQH